MTISTPQPDQRRDSEGSIVFREAETSDAKALNDYIRVIFETTDHLITKPSEFRMGKWRQRRWIAKKHLDPYETCLIAVSDGEIVGMLDNWTDKRARVQHSTCFAMSVKKGWRCKGIGVDLLNHFIKWVKGHNKLIRIELHVHADN